MHSHNDIQEPISKSRMLTFHRSRWERARLIFRPLYVQKGDMVTVKASSGGITIAAMMRAKASGKYGDTIPVEHLTGQGSTTARIVGPRTLESLQVTK